LILCMCILIHTYKCQHTCFTLRGSLRTPASRPHPSWNLVLAMVLWHLAQQLVHVESRKNWHPAPGCASQALNGSLPKSVVPFTGSTWSIFTFYWRYLSYSWGRDTIVVHPLIKGTSWGHHGNIWGIQWWKKNVHINQQHRWLVEPAPRIILC